MIFFSLNGIVQAITSPENMIYTLYIFWTITTLLLEKESLINWEKVYFEGLLQKLIRFLWKL